MDAAGPRKTVCIEGTSKASEAFGMIMRVEKIGWKEARRVEIRKDVDHDLLMIWRGLQSTEANPHRKAWFLDLNCHTMAYASIHEYKGAAFMTKTSYDERYEWFSPGIYLTSVAIRDLFDGQETSRIDFLTAIPFMRA